MHLLRISPKEEKESAKKPQKKVPAKTRAFAVTYLARLEADHLWDGGQTATDNIRPIMLMVAGKPTELTPFLWNIRKGKTADFLENGNEGYRSNKPPRYEILKSQPYAIAQQPLADGNIIATLYLRSLLSMDAGMLDPERCTFVAAVPAWWSREQVVSLDRATQQRVINWAIRYGVHERSTGFGVVKLGDAELFKLAAHAAYIVMYLDRRTKNPIMSDVAFWLHMFFEGLKQGAWSMPQTDDSLRANSYYGRRRDEAPENDPWFFARHSTHAKFLQHELTNFGIEGAYACNIAHTELNTFMSENVTTFLSEYKGNI